MTSLRYPHTRAIDHIDERFGIRVPDPYRWLEDLDAPETEAWVRAQNDLTREALGRSPLRSTVRARLAQLIDYEKWSAPVKRGGRSFAMWNDGMRAQPMLCLLEGNAPKVLVDPNEWSDDGTIALTAFTPSVDGARVAYAIATAGSDWTEWQIVDVDSGRLLDDRIERIRFSSVAWANDGASFFHAAFDADDVTRVRRHTLGTKQAEDALVYERRDHPTWRFQPIVTEDGNWLVIYIFDQTGGPNGIVCKAIETERTVELPDAFRARFAFCGNDGSTFWFVTDLDASRGRLVSIDVEHTERGWTEVIPESGETLQWMIPKRDRLLVGYLADARSVVRRFRMDGTPDGTVSLPGVGWAGGFGGARDDLHTHYLFMSFTQPPAVYGYDSALDQSTLLRDPSLAFDPGAFTTTQSFAAGKDGTRVPIFTTHARHLERDGARPVLLWGYGGFGIPVIPWFWPLAIAWIERGVSSRSRSSAVAANTATSGTATDADRTSRARSTTSSQLRSG